MAAASSAEANSVQIGQSLIGGRRISAAKASTETTVAGRSNRGLAEAVDAA